MSDYLIYRGRCKELAEEAVANDPSLRLVRGHYYCPIWGEQQHWWTAQPDGTVHDPSARQFPSQGRGEYVGFDGVIECSECGKGITEDEAVIHDKYVFCSMECNAHFCGIFG